MTTLRVTIDAFSGRPNPVFELSARESRTALSLLKPSGRLEKGATGLPPAPTLGYRGLVIEQLGTPVSSLPRTMRYVHGMVFGPRVPFRVADEALEDFICGNTGPLRALGLGRGFPVLLRREIERSSGARTHWPWDRKHRSLQHPRCTCAPHYEPAWWNDGAQRQLHNNCYNYAANYRTDSFGVVPGGGQPGAASGAMYTQFTCASVRLAAVADGLVARLKVGNRCPKDGHLVALVIAPNWDFHWYRKDRNAFWSHKPDHMQATNVDNSNALIADPRNADRGPYTQFCTFMVVMHGHVKIK